MIPKVETLGSPKQLALLNDIDKLRSSGISQYVALPQLIVCGDQSSGKSSVLEAISGLQFPTKDNLCTRFATEVILRHSSESRVSVKIVAGPDRLPEDKSKLDGFQKELEHLQDLPLLIDKAKSVMGVGDGSYAFSTDVLRVEVSGPKQPHLTIVDLPGLIHSESKSQTTSDVETVRRMVHEYMDRERSIVLAVISAKNDYANQIVLSYARKVDPQGTRTLGIITKPDTLSVGSENETAYLNLAQNRDVTFRLGWHVLKNRSYETRDASSEERDDSEKEFLGQGLWKSLSRQMVGIDALRDRLSRVLFNHIQAELPRLIENIKEKLYDCKLTIERLGPDRDSLEQQRLFLLRISQDFQLVSTGALDGSYRHSFFGNPRDPEGYSRRLRAVVQNFNHDFAETARLNGQQRKIVDSGKVLKNSTTMVSRANYITEIKKLMGTTRGPELPGMFNPLIISDLFFEQARPWEEIARNHVKNVWEATKLFLESLTSHLADEKTSAALISNVINAFMNQKLDKMNEKLSELLVPYQKGYPMTYNHYFTDNIQKTKAKRREAEAARKLRDYLNGEEAAQVKNMKVKNANVPGLLSALSVSTEADMDRYSCSEILDCMEAYYKVALKQFVDNVAIFAIEHCLLSDLSATFSPSSVWQMDPELIATIASEDEGDKVLRQQTQKQLKILQHGLETCQAHVNMRARQGRNDPPIDLPHIEQEHLSASDKEDASIDEVDEGLETSSPLDELPENVDISPDLEIVTEPETEQQGLHEHKAPALEFSRPPTPPHPPPPQVSFDFGSFSPSVEVQPVAEIPFGSTKSKKAPKIKKKKKIFADDSS